MTQKSERIVAEKIVSVNVNAHEGDTRGPVLETIVSRINFIVAHTKTPIRVIGLSTALANPGDLADWLNVGAGSGARGSAGATGSAAASAGSAGRGYLFNFKPSVRPVPLDVHTAGFPGKNYCPRMATMNKPCYLGLLYASTL